MYTFLIMDRERKDGQKGLDPLFSEVRAYKGPPCPSVQGKARWVD